MKNIHLTSSIAVFLSMTFQTQATTHEENYEGMNNIIRRAQKA